LFLQLRRTHRDEGGVLEDVRLEVPTSAGQVGVARQQDGVEQVLEAQRAVAEGREQREGAGPSADLQSHEAVQQQGHQQATLDLDGGPHRKAETGAIAPQTLQTLKATLTSTLTPGTHSLTGQLTHAQSDTQNGANWQMQQLLALKRNGYVATIFFLPLSSHLAVMYVRRFSALRLFRRYPLDRFY